MALGKRKRTRQRPLWIATDQVAPKSGHPFYSRLNALLDEDGFDEWLEQQCAPYFAKAGRPSIPPGVYFRMLFVGYLEGFQSERSIAWHCADRLSLREFLGYDLHERTPDHSSLSVWRQRLPVDLYQAVFQRILAIVHRHGLVKAYAAGVDSSTVEANASLRRLVRKDSGDTYRAYVQQLMREAGEDPSDTAALVRFDKKREGKSLSNKEWQSETDPDSRITKLKDGRTRLGYKPEHAVDLHTGALLGVTVYPADQGDAAGLLSTLTTVQNNLSTLGDDPPELFSVVTDKGYHRTDVLRQIHDELGVTTYIPERETNQRRKWRGDIASCKVFHANRRRTKGREGKRLGRLRAALVERSFALVKRSGNLARMTVRGLANVTKRYLAHATAFNLALVMRAICGHGTPKGLADALKRLLSFLFGAILGIFAAGIALFGTIRRLAAEITCTRSCEIATPCHRLALA